MAMNTRLRANLNADVSDVVIDTKTGRPFLVVDRYADGTTLIRPLLLPEWDKYKRRMANDLRRMRSGVA